MAPLRRGATRVLPLFCLLLLSGCAELGYYAQSVSGHLSLISAREPLERVIDDPSTPMALRERLALAQRAREFASTELSLPRDGSYTSYVQLDRPYVVWTVVAAPPLSLEPRTWCFPVAGCVAYRGYFDEADARAYGAELAAAGDDVHVAGVTAYSTLGWFDDPLLSSMVDGTLYDLVGVIFHELAHRELYLPGDTNFNEAFAVAVEREGLRRWLASEGDAVEQQRYQDARRRRGLVVRLTLEWRDKLELLYASSLPDDTRRQRKQALLAELREAYLASVRQEPALGGAEAFFGEGLNNARLVSIATYHALVPAFEKLLAEQGGELAAFYAACAALAELAEAERARRLEDLGAAP